jgi:hypothetical protein
MTAGRASRYSDRPASASSTDRKMRELRGLSTTHDRMSNMKISCALALFAFGFSAPAASGSAHPSNSRCACADLDKFARLSKAIDVPNN